MSRLSKLQKTVAGKSAVKRNRYVDLRAPTGSQRFGIFGGVPSPVLINNKTPQDGPSLPASACAHQKVVTTVLLLWVTIHTYVPYDPQTKGGIEKRCYPRHS